MYKILQKHRRHLLAIFTAGLMVAFLIPSFSRNSRGGSNMVIGSVAGEKLYANEKGQAARDWDLLSRRLFVYSPSQYSQSPFRPVAYQLGPVAVDQIEQHPELYLLLQKEAVKLGVFVPQDQVESLYSELQTQLDMTKVENVDAVKQALGRFLMVNYAFEQATSAIKISQPYLAYELATRYQKMKLSAIEYNAVDYASKVPAPTKEQLQALFDKYADIDPAQADAKTNPFGIGYRFADRVKLQYVCIPADKVRDIVKAGKPQSRWEVDAWKYYDTNPGRFQSTTQESTGMDMNLGLTADAKPKTIATTKPFSEAKNDVMEAIIQPEVEKLTGSILQKVNSIVATDWAAYQKDANAKSSLNVPYASYEYLQKLSDVISAQFKVSLKIQQWPDFLSADDLRVLGAVGNAQLTSGTPMPIYATLTDELAKKLQRRDPTLPKPLAILQPSQSLRDYTGNTYIFRLTAFDKARKPASLDEVAAKVEKDWRTMEASRLAKAAADAVLPQVKEKGLAAVAKDLKKNVMDSGPFSRGGTVTGLHISDDNSDLFTAEAAGLLSDKAAAVKPVRVLDLPKAGRVFVAELTEVKSDLPADKMGQATKALDSMLERQFAQLFSSEWFNFKKVSDRLKYVPSKDADAPIPMDDSSPMSFPEL